MAAKRPTLERAREIARDVFHLETLHPEQEQALPSILAGKDTLAILPTGSGKSLLYQVPALLMKRPTVVVSPLLSLMRDQEVKLAKLGVPVVRLDGSLKAQERRDALARVKEGGPLLVFTTPETLGNPEVRKALGKKVSLFVVDEAHCISEWGHDFRPSYLRLAAARRALGDPPTLALTATATPPVREAIEASLQLEEPARVIAAPHRPNLRFTAESLNESDKPARAGKVLRRLRRPGIVYCSTTAAVDLLWGALNRGQIPTTRYHGKMAAKDREVEQRRFMKPRRRLVMVATSAFGLGIDKPNIRYILHYQAPGSLEQYVQEAGRAGRDGWPSRCLLLLSEEDLKTQEFLLARGRSTGHQLERVGQALLAWTKEGRAVSAKDLALSAQVPLANAASILANLGDIGAVEEDEDGFRAALEGDEFQQRIGDLARRLETKRTADARRISSVREYVSSKDCRSVFLRRYFGEVDPPACGQCDRCRPEEHSTQALEAALDAIRERPKRAAVETSLIAAGWVPKMDSDGLVSATKQEIERPPRDDKRGKRRRRRRRRRRGGRRGGRGGQGGQSGQGGPGGQGGQGGPPGGALPPPTGSPVSSP